MHGLSLCFVGAFLNDTIQTHTHTHIGSGKQQYHDDEALEERCNHVNSIFLFFLLSAFREKGKRKYKELEMMARLKKKV